MKKILKKPLLHTSKYKVSLYNIECVSSTKVNVNCFPGHF